MILKEKNQKNKEKETGVFEIKIPKSEPIKGLKGLMLK